MLEINYYQYKSFCNRPRLYSPLNFIKMFDCIHTKLAISATLISTFDSIESFFFYINFIFDYENSQYDSYSIRIINEYKYFL